MNRAVFLIGLLLLSGLAYSESEKNVKESGTLPITIAYYGDTITHPGMMVGVEFSLLQKMAHELFVTINVGSYIHPRNHIPVFGRSEIGYRYTFNSGFNLHTVIGAGYFHKFLDGEIYVYEDDLLVSVPNTGRPKFMPSLAVGAGWNFFRQTDIPVDVFLRLETFGEYPVNTLFIPHVAILAGVRIFL